MPMRDLAGTKILVTGATDGLGRRVALKLAAKGATVLLHGRTAIEAAAVEAREGG
jgi:NAD(P)-dependent dehydrogenase (short-subunit alcohol dehydrogenase family)